jgi:hypothetical protein
MLRLGTPLLAKLNLAIIFVPRYSLGTSEKSGLWQKKGAGQCPPFFLFDDAGLIQGTQSTEFLSDPHYAARNRLASMPYCLIL